MKTKTVITASLVLALAGTANAEPGKFRKWLQDKTAPRDEQTAVVVQGVPQPLTAEQQACNKFYSDLNAGKIAIDSVSEKRNNECRKIRDEQQAAAAASATHTQSVVEETKRPSWFRRMGREMRNGCLGGTLLGALNRQVNLENCVAGALTAGVHTALQQLKQARDVETAAKAAGGQATVTTTTTTGADGKAEEKLEALTLNYKPDEMAALSPAVVGLLDKIATLAKADQRGGLTFIFTGENPVCQIPIQELTKRGALAKNTVVDRCGSGEYGITISPDQGGR